MCDILQMQQWSEGGSGGGHVQLLGWRPPPSPTATSPGEQPCWPGAVHLPRVETAGAHHEGPPASVWLRKYDTWFV